MSGIKVSQPPEGLSGRKYSRIHKQGVGEALKQHRKAHLPFHFENEAFLRYPGVYGKHHRAQSGIKSAIRQRKKKNKVQDKFDAMDARGNTQGILAFRRLLAGEKISELEMAAIVEGGESLTSIRTRNSINARRKRRGEKRKNNIYKPLNQSGLLRSMALRGTAKVGGPAHLVSISIPGPYYLNINRGEFNKREALAVFNQHEEVILVRNLDKQIQKQLDKVFK